MEKQLNWLDEIDEKKQLPGETWSDMANRFLKMVKTIDNLGNTDWNDYVKILNQQQNEMFQSDNSKTT